MRSENFLLCFGAQRGGTTWLSNQLWHHPKFSFPPRKELRYFDTIHYHNFNVIQKERIKELRRALWNKLGENPKNLTKELESELKWMAKYTLVSKENYNDVWYESLFNQTAPDKWTGDFSPDYSLLPKDGIEHLYNMLPDAKLVFMLRDPVDRIWSGLTYTLRNNPNLSDTEKIKFLKNGINSQIQLKFSDYKSIFEKFLNFYQKKQICVCFHDDIIINPQKIISTVFNHIGENYNNDYFKNTSKSVNRSPSIELNDEILATISLNNLDLLKWLNDEFGGYASQWLNKAENYL